MSSAVQSALKMLQLNNYGSLVIVAAISYDYCLTYSREVTYIWERPWTMVSTLFLLTRYIGCLSALIFALAGSSFIPGPIEANLGYSEGNIIYILGIWAHAFFWVGADVLMILRVYAMYNQSRIILVVLLVVLITEVVILLVSCGIYSDPKYSMLFVAQLLGSAVCGVVLSTQTWNNVTTIIQLILGTVLFILVAAQFVRNSVQMYRTTRRWQMNRYMNLLVRDGLLYFLVALLNSLITALGLLGTIPQGWPTIVLGVASSIPIYTLTPRFVMNVRELYMSDTQGRVERDIDTGFGLSSGAGRAVGGATTIETMAFAEGGETEGMEGGEEITTVERRAQPDSNGRSV